MILVDDRIGSRDLLPALRQMGLSCELQRLDFADIAFVGRGVNNADVYIGIELKETRDLLSSLYSSRFAGHQLPGLITTYDRAWLVTEGIWRVGDEGVLEVLQGGWRPATIGRRCVMASDIESWILTQTIRGGLSYRHCPKRSDTVRFVSTLFHWWTHKSLEEHRSHAVIYQPPPDRAIFTDVSTERKMLNCIPKVGWDKSAVLEQHFKGSLRQILSASPKELTAVEGIGPTIAANIEAIR